MKSMTGFGTHRAQSTDVALEISVRSVNGRFLEPRFHLPREYMGFESELRRILAEKIKRGTVDVFITRRVRATGSKAAITVNRELARRYVQSYRSLARDLKLAEEIHLEVIARLPEVVKLEESSEADPKEKALLLKSFKAAAEACLRERMREGKALQKELERMLSQLDRQVQDILSLREDANKQLQEKFESRLAGRLKGGELDPQRLSQEIVLQLDKSDINEELQRLGEHIKNYRQILISREAEGKKLDFYTQELLREVNTVGSKSQVARITQAVVEAKTIIERLREQVQNVE